ncbi:MAG: tRNA 2-selenouridine(34) synthase MnmH [Bacteroidetes bacterium]|nr:tRNA 2-selenouridine(34) synthase MnmH [Bacteroidota bacterium]
MQILSVEKFIELLAQGYTCIDTRSPGEYMQAHLPEAASIPLLNNEERAIVGTVFKQQGRTDAIIKGFEIAGANFAGHITSARQLSPDNKVLVYCWRGGLRSNIMAWLLNLAGMEVFVLKGGYKAFRNYVLAQMCKSWPLLIIGGKTGVGKTEILHQLLSKNQACIDLEELASHKGSAFGHLGQKPQPSSEHFENMLAVELEKVKGAPHIFVENESNKIGAVQIPAMFFKQMREAMVIQIERDFEERKKRILQEYGHFDKALLAQCTHKVAKRLGGLRLQQAIEALEYDNMNLWVMILMEYYDKTYTHSNNERNKEHAVYINADNFTEEMLPQEIIRITNELNLKYDKANTI